MLVESSEIDHSHALTDEEYRQSLGSGYIFFEITEPEELSFTYKVRRCKKKDLVTPNTFGIAGQPRSICPQLECESQWDPAGAHPASLWLRLHQELRPGGGQAGSHREGRVLLRVQSGPSPGSRGSGGDRH